MAVTGWTWSELQETPADVVEDLALYLAVKDTWEHGGELDVWRDEHGRRLERR